MQVSKEETMAAQLPVEDLEKLNHVKLPSGATYEELLANSNNDGVATTLIPIPPKKVPLSLLCQICMEEPQFIGLQQRIQYAEQQAGGRPRYIVARPETSSVKRVPYEPEFQKNLWVPENDLAQKKEDPVAEAWQYQQYLKYVQQQRDQHLSYLQYQQWLQWYLRNNPPVTRQSNSSFVLQPAPQQAPQQQAAHGTFVQLRPLH